MKIGSSVFDEGFDFEVLFSINKRSTYGPADTSMPSLVIAADGSCKRTCVDTGCECPYGNCPESDCWGSKEDCECWDAYAGDSGRCVKGKFCQEGCEDCCNGGRPGKTCEKDYRDNYLNSGDVNVYSEFEPLGDSEDGCPPPGFLDAQTTDPSCCTKGTCRYARSASTLGYNYYCLSGVSKSFCMSFKKDSANSDVQFTCCLGASSSCDCEKVECPSGMPERECTSSEVWTHKEGSFGQNDDCYCNCKSAYEVGPITVDGSSFGKLCVVCGENSKWESGPAECKCNEGYETPSGTDAFGLAEFDVSGPSMHPDGRQSATSPACVPKKYKCDETKDPPECVYAPVGERDGTVYDLTSGCVSAGCGRYKCESGECVPDTNPSAPYADKKECEESKCRNHKCVEGGCVPDESGLHVGIKKCQDAGCGGKWFCNAAAECKQVSLDPLNPLPDGAREFDTEGDCEASCGKYYCDSVGECKQFKQGQEPETSNTLLFSDETACSGGNCGKYYCDDAANLCRKAGEMDAAGKPQYWEGTPEGKSTCEASCSCAGPASNSWSLANEFNECTEPNEGSPCSSYTAFMSCMESACNTKYGLCKENQAETKSYVSCSGGDKACVEAKKYVEDDEGLNRMVTACRERDYWFLYSAGGPYKIGECIRERYGDAVRLGHRITRIATAENDVVCTGEEQTTYVTPVQTYISNGKESNYPRPTDSDAYFAITYKPC